MISRIYVTSKEKADLINSYLLSHKLGTDKISKIAAALTNPILEEFSINKFPDVGRLGSRRPTSNFTYAIEIGFKPGVTDNVGHGLLRGVEHGKPPVIFGFFDGVLMV